MSAAGGRVACGAALLAALLPAVPAAAAAPAGSLQSGARISDCWSALRVGISSCGADVGARASPPDAGNAPAHAGAGGVTETQIDDYLSNYGKPPREAVRALLDPSDENIAAMLRRHNEIVAVAAFVAARMTALQARGAEGDGATTQPVPPELPAMMQMRAELYCAPGDPQGRAAARALSRLAAVFPSLQAQLTLVVTEPAPEHADQSAVSETALPVRSIDGGDAAGQPLPLLQLTDLRYRTSRSIDAQALTVDRIKAAIVALRAEAEARARPAPRW